jgi:hypothetical protein
VIIEMRTYKTKPGKRTEFLEIFESKSVPAHQDIGMTILGPFLSVEDPDTFFFMRGFPDLESRERLKEQFYEGDLWKQELQHESRPGHGPGRRCTHLPDMRFPAPSSSSQSSTFPAASHQSDTVELGAAASTPESRLRLRPVRTIAIYCFCACRTRPVRGKGRAHL